MRLTKEQYLEILSRTKSPQSRSSTGCSREADLHRFVLEECSRRMWIVFHGAMAHRTFRTPGEPDFVILMHGGKMLMIEAKTGTGKLSPDQRAIAAWANQLGHTIHVVRSEDDWHALLEKEVSNA